MSVRPSWTPPAWRVLILLFILVLLLNVFDALSTLEIIRRGGQEANPVAEAMFLYGDSAFFFLKTGLAAVCAATLACLARVHPAAGRLLWAAAAVYAGIAGLHVYLLWLWRP